MRSAIVQAPPDRCEPEPGQPHECEFLWFLYTYTDEYGNATSTIVPGANLTGANLSGADARGANFHLRHALRREYQQSDSVRRAHCGPRPDGRRVAGRPRLRRQSGRESADGPLPIVVDQHLAMDATGTLRLVFDADPWDSTISFAPGIPVARGGTLELTFAPDVNLASQIGRTIDLFDWTGVDAHRRVHRFQPLHLEPLQALHHRRSDAHRRGRTHARRLQRRQRRRRRRPRTAGEPALAQPATPRARKATPTATTTSTAPTSSPGNDNSAAAAVVGAQTPSPSRRRQSW